MLKRRTLRLAGMVFAGILCTTTLANASPIGSTAPLPGFENDNGAERFISDGLFFTVELKESPGQEFGSFGIYYDPETLITLFGADDVGWGQVAMVDLTHGVVMDVDRYTFDYFNPQLGDFGFFFETDGNVTYSQADLNLGNGTSSSVGTYQSIYSDQVFLITHEVWSENLRETFTIEAVGGIRAAGRPIGNPVPEPAGALLFGLGAMVIGGATRRGRA